MKLSTVDAHILGGGKLLNFVGVDSSNKYYSPVCANWDISAITGTFPGQTGTWTSSVNEGSEFVAIDADPTTSTIFHSNDGNTWTSVAPPTAGGYFQVAYDGTTYFAPKFNGNVLIKSTNGTTWTSSSVLPSSLNWTGAAYNGSKYIVVFYNPASFTATIAYSSNLTTWTSTTATIPEFANDPNFITAGNGMFAAPGIYSYDGVTWNVSTAILTYTYGKTIYGRGFFMCPFIDYPGSSSGVAYSSDGVNWSYDITIDADGWTVFGNNRFYQQTTTGVATSTTGTSWVNVVTSSPSRMIGYGAI